MLNDVATRNWQLATCNWPPNDGSVADDDDDDGDAYRTSLWRSLWATVQEFNAVARCQLQVASTV